jgi:hypothetical protein
MQNYREIIFETQESYARMLTNMFHGLVVDAKRQRKNS